MLTQDVLRISISDKCNLNCLYCRPHGDGEYTSKEHILKYEEIVRIIQLLTPLGIKRIRITGGEPTLRRDAHLFIGMINKVQGIEDISLTSNGIALNNKLALFKSAGLKRINISLDTLNKTTFTRITGFDGLARVLESIDTALAVGLDPVKINVVPLKGINDSEALDFVQLAFDKKLHVRFLEYFYTNENVIEHEKYFVSNDVFRRRIIEKYGSLVRTHAIDGNGPARKLTVYAVPLCFLIWKNGISATGADAFGYRRKGNCIFAFSPTNISILEKCYATACRKKRYTVT